MNTNATKSYKKYSDDPGKTQGLSPKNPGTVPELDRETTAMN